MKKYNDTIKKLKLEFGNQKHIGTVALMKKIKEKEKELSLVIKGGKAEKRIKGEIKTLKRQVIFLHEEK